MPWRMLLSAFFAPARVAVDVSKSQVIGSQVSQYAQVRGVLGVDLAVQFKRFLEVLLRHVMPLPIAGRISKVVVGQSQALAVTRIGGVVFVQGQEKIESLQLIRLGQVQAASVSEQSLPKFR